MIEEIKTDIFSSLFDIVEDTENHKKIKNVIDNLSNPLIVKVKYLFYFLLLMNFFIIMLLMLNIYVSIKQTFFLEN